MTQKRCRDRRNLDTKKTIIARNGSDTRGISRRVTATLVYQGNGCNWKTVLIGKVKHPKPSRKWHRYLHFLPCTSRYHKQFFHGISSVSGQHFAEPLEQRVGENDIIEGLCHQCGQFVPVCNGRRKNNLLWYRHAHKVKKMVKWKIIVPPVICWQTCNPYHVQHSAMFTINLLNTSLPPHLVHPKSNLFTLSACLKFVPTHNTHDTKESSCQV